MISSGSHCVATLICKEVKDKVSLEYLGESIGKGLSDKNWSGEKGRERMWEVQNSEGAPKTEQTLKENEVEVSKNSLPLLPCKYQTGRVVTGGLGSTGLEMGYRGSWSPGHG